MGRAVELKKTWREHLLDKNFRVRAGLTFFFLAVVLFSLAKFLPYNETRPGFSMDDPFLDLFSPIKVTWLTFGLIYLGLIVAVTSLSFYPEKFLLAFQSYTVIALFRLATIYFLPLNAPAATIPLRDPVVEFFGGGSTLLRDLFFSGHTSMMFLFFLVSPNKTLKRIYLIATFLVAACVLVQHVHYTIDVIAAPVFAYTGYRIALLVDSHIKNLE
ncbi:MAG: sphingomyelin synthase family protein [Bacteroidetes bacterium]|nr:sphingomyelin synthase family protein [Bacteroidota bacterium]